MTRDVHDTKSLMTRGHGYDVGRGFDTNGDIEEAVKRLENEHKREKPFVMTQIVARVHNKYILACTMQFINKKLVHCLK